MDPIFAIEATHLAQPTPLALISSAGAHGLVPDVEAMIAASKLRPWNGMRRAGEQQGEAAGAGRSWWSWETLDGTVVAAPVHATAPGWTGLRFELLVDHVAVPILTGALNDAQGEPVTLVAGDAVHVTGYRTGSQTKGRLMAVKIERQAVRPHEPVPVQLQTHLSVGPYAELTEGLDGSFTAL